MLSYCLVRSSEHHDGSLGNILFPERVVVAGLLVKEGGAARERERERGGEDIKPLKRSSLPYKDRIEDRAHFNRR